MRRILKYSVVIAATFLFSMPSQSQTVEDRAIEDEAVSWLKEFLRVDTTNPPGNEMRAVEFYAAIFDAEGIPWKSASSADGRGNIWARLKGGDKPALILLQHTDVVPADPDFWTVDPFSGEEKDGYIYGRGAVDMKGGGIAQLAAFLSLHRSGITLNRDLVFVATADEEAGGFYGAGWLIENHPEVFEGAGMLLNEGGGGRVQQAGLVFDIEVTQKVPVWLRLVATDNPGHGSMPQTTSATGQLIEGLERIRTHAFPARIVPAVDVLFKGLSETMIGEQKAAYADMASAILEPGFLDDLQARSPFHHALTRDTCSITRFGASPKINVVPPSAWAEIDCRMLPDRPSEDFIADVAALLVGLDIKIETIMAFTPAVSSTDSVLYETIKEVMLERYPDAHVIPSVTSGFTDSHFTRDLGIDSFGFMPLIMPTSEFTRIHGNDERVEIIAFRRSIRDMIAIVTNVVQK